MKRSLLSMLPVGRETIVQTITVAGLLLAGTTILFNSCFLHYYKTNTVKQPDTASIRKLVNAGKYFILHSRYENFALAEPALNNGNLEGELALLPAEHQTTLSPQNEKTNRFSKKYADAVLYEVHLYTNDSAAYQTRISIPVKDLYRLDVYELNKKATTRSEIVSIVGISATILGVIAVIVAATAFNNDGPVYGPTTIGTCSPQVYVLDQGSTRLAGILYSGAIFAPLRRTDYLPLKAGNHDVDSFHLQIRGSSNEELVIHSTKLIQVLHDTATQVLVDRYGKILTFHDPVTPAKSVNTRVEDLEMVSANDGNYYSFTNKAAGEQTSDLILRFKKPAGASSGKLILTAKNSPWAIYLFNKYKSLYGGYYPTLQKQKDKADRTKLLQCEKDQSLPLSVFVKEAGNWKFVDYFLTPGNELLRDMIMEIDLSALKKSDHVEIRLATTFMFWNLDLAAMDFSANLSCLVKEIPAYKVVNGSNTNAVATDSAGDTRISGDDCLSLDFAVTQNRLPDQCASYFLVGNGYYHDNKNYQGKPQLDKIAAFSHKGAFDRFSRQTFNEFYAQLKEDPANAISSRN